MSGVINGPGHGTLESLLTADRVAGHVIKRGITNQPEKLVAGLKKKKTSPISHKAAAAHVGNRGNKARGSTSSPSFREAWEAAKEHHKVQFGEHMHVLHKQPMAPHEKGRAVPKMPKGVSEEMASSGVD